VQPNIHPSNLPTIHLINKQTFQGHVRYNATKYAPETRFFLLNIQTRKGREEQKQVLIIENSFDKSLQIKDLLSQQVYSKYDTKFVVKSWYFDVRSVINQNTTGEIKPMPVNNNKKSFIVQLRRIILQNNWQPTQQLPLSTTFSAVMSRKSKTFTKVDHTA